MEKLNYVLKTQERVLMPVKQGFGFRLLKVFVCVVVAIIVLFALFLQINLLADMEWYARWMLIVLIAWILLHNKKEDVPSYMELRFYDSYLVIFRPKRYYNKRVTRMQFDKMRYSDITRCVYKSESKAMVIYGNVYATQYDYDAYGRLTSAPTYNRLVEGGMCFFSARCAPDVDFVAEIEEHSPIKVEILNIQDISEGVRSAEQSVGIVVGGLLTPTS